MILLSCHDAQQTEDHYNLCPYEVGDRENVLSFTEQLPLSDADKHVLRICATNKGQLDG